MANCMTFGHELNGIAVHSNYWTEVGSLARKADFEQQQSTAPESFGWFSSSVTTVMAASDDLKVAMAIALALLIVNVAALMSRCSQKCKSRTIERPVEESVDVEELLNV